MDFHLITNGTDETLPLLYQWEIHDDRTGELRGRYVGKTVSGSNRPRNDYARNVKNLLAGLPYRKGKSDGYREIHRALAEAVRNGDRITLTLLRNVNADEDINAAERAAILALDCGLNGAPGGLRARSDNNLKHATHSVLRERIVEHVFVGAVMRRLWQLGAFDVDVLRAEFDAGGYDLVMSSRSVIRHIQFKASLTDGARANISVNMRLSQVASGCVIWLGVTDDLDIKEYRWFGADAGFPLPDISDHPMPRQTRGNAQGVKAERKDQRVLRKGEFETLDGLDDVLHRLFGPRESDQTSGQGT